MTDQRFDISLKLPGKDRKRNSKEGAWLLTLRLKKQTNIRSIINTLNNESSKVILVPAVAKQKPASGDSFGPPPRRCEPAHTRPNKGKCAN